MVVTLGALNTQSEQRCSDNLYRVGHHLVPAGRIVRTATCTVSGHAKKTSGRQQFNLRVREVAVLRSGNFVAGNLFGDESVERFVLVQRSDDPVAILPCPGADGVGSRVAL